MFTIYADNKPLYVPTLTGSGYGVFSPRLAVELSKAGSLEFTLPPSNVMYEDLKKLKSTVKVFQDDAEIFEGRVLHDEKDFFKQKKVYCEGELAYLLDSTVRPTRFTDKDAAYVFEKLIDRHNERMTSESNDTSKNFTVGNVTVSGKISCYIKDYPVTFDAIASNLIELFGGYITVRKKNGVRYIDWISNSDQNITSTQTIEFGVNMLDISEYITAENVFTRIIPLGAETDGVKLKINSDTGDAIDYLRDPTAESLFGVIERKVDFDEVTSARKLRKLGSEYLKKNIEMAISLTVRAIDLEGLYVNSSAIKIGDWVQVVSIPHGLNKPFQCTKIIYNLESPDQNEYSFGVEYASLTSQQVKNKKGAANLSSIVIEEEEATT